MRLCIPPSRTKGLYYHHDLKVPCIARYDNEMTANLDVPFTCIFASELGKAESILSRRSTAWGYTGCTHVEGQGLSAGTLSLGSLDVIDRCMIVSASMCSPCVLRTAPVTAYGWSFLRVRFIESCNLFVAAVTADQIQKREIQRGCRPSTDVKNHPGLTRTVPYQIT